MKITFAWPPSADADEVDAPLECWNELVHHLESKGAERLAEQVRGIAEGTRASPVKVETEERATLRGAARRVESSRDCGGDWAALTGAPSGPAA